MRRIQRNNLVCSFIAAILTLASSFGVNAQVESDRERDGLIGLVRSILLEEAAVTCREGTCVEEKTAWSDRTEYDRSGRMLGDRGRFSTDDPLARMLFYPFDKTVARIEKPIHDENGKLLYLNVYTYENKTRRAELINYDASGVPRYGKRICFDEHGKLAEESFFDGKGRLEAWTRFKRDQRGNTIEEEEAEGSFHQKIVSSYVFDDAGNWLKASQSWFLLTKGQFILRRMGVKNRSIAYFEVPAKNDSPRPAKLLRIPNEKIMLILSTLHHDAGGIRSITANHGDQALFSQHQN